MATINRHCMKTLVKFLLAISAGLPIAALAQAYPSKPITLVLPTGVGGTSDVIARTMGQVMSENLKVAIIPDNRPGANGVIGVQQVMRAPPDGYNVLFTTSSTMILNKFLVKNLPYEPATHFVPIGVVGRSALFVGVPANSRFANVGEMITAARKEPDRLTYGSATAVPRLAGELFKQLTNTKLLNVPYKSQGAMLTALIAGEIDMTITDNASLFPLFQGGRARPLAVSSAKRSPDYPNVPTLDEAGVKGYELTYWNAMYVRAGTPPEVIARLEEAFKVAANSHEMQKYMASNGIEPMVLVGADALKLHKVETERVGLITSKAGILPE